MLAKIEQRVVLFAVAVAAVETQRRADAFLQLHHFFMPQAAHTQYPAAVTTGNLCGDKIHTRQPGRIKINLFNQRLRGARDQPDVGIVGVEVTGEARLYNRERGDMTAKPVRKLLF